MKNRFALTVKRAVAMLLTQPWVGEIVGLMTRGRIPAFGLRINTRNSAISGRIKAKLFFEIYESAERRFLSKYIPNDSDVIELGASIGVVTCLLRKAVAQQNKVVAVEANPNLIPLLRRNLTLNGSAEGTFVEEVAISYANNVEVDFQLSSHSTDGRLVLKGKSTANCVVVAATTLSNILENHGIESFCLVCDIEGAEWAMFENDLDELVKARIIIMELHKSMYGEDWRVLQERILATGKFELIDEYGPTCVFRPRCALQVGARLVQ